MQTATRSLRAPIVAISLFAVVAAATLLSGAPTANAQTTNVHLMELSIGAIEVVWDGLEAVSDGHMLLSGAEASGPVPVGSIHIAAMVDQLDALHMVILLVAVNFALVACTVTIHGPLLINHVSGNDFHNFFADIGAVGGILIPSGFGCDLIRSIVLELVEDNGVLAHFEIF